MNDWISNLWHGTKLALFLPVGRDSFVVSANQIVGFYVVNFLLVALIDYLAVGEGAQFNSYGFSYSVYMMASAVFGYFIISRCLSNNRFATLLLISTSAFFVLNLALTIYVAYAYEGNYQYYNAAELNIPSWLYLVVYVWSIILLCQAIAISFDSKPMVCLGWSLLFHVFVIGCQSMGYEQKLFWSFSGYEEIVDEEIISVENTYYNQENLLQKKFDNLTSEDPSKKDVYLATFASYGYQDVFKKEVEFVEESVSRRYGSDVKTIRLINHDETLEQFALANQPNLSKVLLEFNHQMDTENDLLMLYLTSHGSRDAVLSADLYPLEPEPLSGSILRQSLDESGIKWRVIIVSACYSGSFIEYLQDPNTLIITAAEFDKTSFGCSNDRELTYFAEAFFKHAWPMNLNLIDTFDAATQWVTNKESEEGLENSNPQISIGENIKDYLLTFDN